MTRIIEALEWRYATKAFDSNKKLSNNQVAELKKITQLSASSFGLQPYKVIIINNQDLKDKLKPASYAQAQISDASHLFLFCAMKEFTKNDVNDFVDLSVEITGTPKEKMKFYHDMMDMKIDSMSKEENMYWASKQAYIALGNLLTGAAALEIDTCPIEGFIPQQYIDILGLDKMGLEPLVLAAVGFRADSDKYQHIPKVRKKNNNLFIEM